MPYWAGFTPARIARPKQTVARPFPFGHGGKGFFSPLRHRTATMSCRSARTVSAWLQPTPWRLLAGWRVCHRKWPKYGAPVIRVTGTLQKDAWDRDVLPPVEQVRPGLWSVPVPIPNNPLRYVLVYMFELDDGGVAMVDAGWNTDECWQALSNGLAEAGGSVSDVQAVLVTHIHPDHYGLAGRVRDASGAWVGLHPADAAQLQDRYVNTDETVARMQALLELCGVPPSEVDDLALASMHVRNLVEMAEPDVLFEDG